MHVDSLINGQFKIQNGHNAKTHQYCNNKKSHKARTRHPVHYFLENVLS